MSARRGGDDRPGSSVILVRSTSYGVAAGATVGAILGSTLGFGEPAPWLVGLIVAGFGAAIGGSTGLVLGVILVTAGRRRSSSIALRAVVALAGMAVVTSALWIVSGRFPIDSYLWLFIGPAGIATWILVPVVLRPERHRPMSKLPGQST